jgi:hypothetical protein
MTSGQRAADVEMVYYLDVGKIPSAVDDDKWIRAAFDTPPEEKTVI